MITEDNDGSNNNEYNNNQSRQLLPKQFYCPVTEEIFQHPVVLSDGDSYERSAMEEFGYLPSRLYLNRSLQQIIKESASRAEENGSSINEREKKNPEGCRPTTIDYQTLPDAFYCPITMDLMTDPVIDKDGMTYERDAIMQWIQVNGKSPVTREAASTEDLYPNNAIYTLIHHELGNDASIYPKMEE